ncbi:MAG: threonine/serine exporter family protein [Erysipelotrichaceae bacterium]|nr:threonine/serine exporter family protein [Erysipelotrichaceae bacterium]
MDALMQAAMQAGSILLMSGAETYRVEETVVRIFEAYDVKESNCFVLPTGIFSSFVYEGKNYSSVRRIKHRSTDLHRIDAVNDLARSVVKDQISLEELQQRLDMINSERSYSDLTMILFAAISAGFFALFFEGTLMDAVAALVIGAIVKVLLIQLHKEEITSFFVTALGGGLTAALAVLSVKLGIGNHVDTISISVLMLMVPGLAITNAIRDTIAGDLTSGVSRAVEAVLIAVSLAVGAGTALSLLKIWGVM